MFEDGIQSYFGESDSDFFGDTSNDMIFGEGYGEQAVDGSQFFSEAVGFSSDGGEFINEATAFDMDGEVFTELDSSIPNSTDFDSHGRRGWVDGIIKRQIQDARKASNEASKKAYAKGASYEAAEDAGHKARDKVFAAGADAQLLGSELDATYKHMNGMADIKDKHHGDRRDKSKAKADAMRPVSAQNSGSSGTPIKRSSDGKVVGRSYPAGDKRLGSRGNK